MPSFWCVLKNRKIIKSEISRLVPSDISSMSFLGIRNLYVYNLFSDIDGDRLTITFWGLMTYIFRKIKPQTIKGKFTYNKCFMGFLFV